LTAVRRTKRPAVPAETNPIKVSTKPKAQPSTKESPALRKLYGEYVDARKKNNEKVSHLKYEDLQKKIERMRPSLEKKHEGKQIDFKVVVRDGKVGIKPVVKK
jgi:hypothetical protein